MNKIYNKTNTGFSHSGSLIRRVLFVMSLILISIPAFLSAHEYNTESFESGFPSSGWSTSGSTNYLFATSSGVNPAQSPHSGSAELEWQSYNASNGTTAGLITPVIDWAYRGGNTPTVSFWLYRDVTNYNSTAYDLEGVKVFANSSGVGATLLGFVPRRGGVAATGAYLASGVATTTTSGWYQYTFNIPSSYNGSDNYIAFDFYSQYGNNTFIDDIQYISYPNPVSLTANPQTTCTGIPVAFTNACTNPNAVYYELYFGDGASYAYTGITTVNHTYNYSGNFGVYIYAYDMFYNYIAYNYMYIDIQPGTNGSINASKDSICPGGDVYFDPNYNGTPLQWMINGASAATPGTYSFSHTFPTLGTYTVSAIFNTACGVDTINRLIHVVNTVMPNAEFTLSPSPAVCPNVNLQASPTEYQGTHFWNFGDGYTSTTPTPYHPYASIGTKTITHSITNSCGNTSNQSHTISVDNTSYPTNANFSYNPSTPLCPGVQINFNSQNYEGQWAWDFGDGITTTGQNPRHTYATAGTYTVTHTITNQCNNSLSSTQVLVISSTISPDATFNMGPNPACPNDIISFNPNEQNGSLYLWNFGDGTTSTLKYPSHQYTTAGSYNVGLTVTNTCNNTSASSSVVQINGGMHINISANLNAGPMPACPNQPVNFYVGAYGFPIYEWHYGDGVVETTANTNTTHAYGTAGVYSAYVRVVNNCGMDTALYTTVNINSSIPFPNYPMNAYPLTACPGENVSASAPSGFPNYEWNMGDGSPLITSNNPYISYSYSSTGNKIITVKLTDYCGNDSTYRDTVSIMNRTTFCAAACSVNVYANTPACPNQSINFNASYGYAWYKWKFGDGDSLISSSAQATHSYPLTGTYNYTVTITNFCGTDTTIYSSLEINNSQQINNWTNVYAYPDIVCPNQAVQFSTDNNYNTYVWNFGDGYIANGTGTVAHTYTVAGTYNTSVTITNACGNSASFSTSITVSNTAAFPNWMSMWNEPDPACPGSPVTLRTTEGYASYNWNFGDGNIITTSTGVISHIYAAAGNYPASVTVTNSCGLSATVYKTVAISNTVNISYLDLQVPNNPACVNDQVILSVSAGAGGPGGGGSLAGITFVWDYGDGSPLDTTTGAGSSHVYVITGVYNVIVTATNACGNSRTASKIVTINNGAIPHLDQSSFGILTQNMNGNSSVSVCPGDVLVYYFRGENTDNLWNFGDGNTGVAVDVIAGDDGNTYTIIRHTYSVAGTYNYSLTLGNHCGNHVTQVKPVIVTSGMLISGGLAIGAPSSAQGYTTCGLINFISFGGSNFVWDFGDGDTLSTLSPLVNHSYANAGNYTVKVTVTNGCGNSATYIKTLIVNGVGGTVVSASSTISPTCNNGTDGSVAVNVSGGQAPYTYNWTNSIGQSISTSGAVASLPAGTYSVIVTDVSGCEGYATIVLTNPSPMTTSVGVTPSSCGGSTGSATVSGVVGGTAPYTYLWSTGQTTSSVSSLALGTYTVTVHDNKGCTSTANASISESGATVSVASTTTVSCNGGTNGALSINVSGGTAPYTYAWSNGATTQNLTGLAAGNYSVIVTDNGNCHSTISTSVNQPATLAVNATAGVSPTCGNHDGSVIANVSGGTAPYTYLWSTGGTLQTKSNLFAGQYTVTVTDAHGCINNGVVTLSNSNAPNVVSTINNISCNGLTDGSINLAVSGGTGPYGFSWNTGSFNQNVTGLAPGFYFVQILDGAGCNSFRSFTISQPAVLTTTASSNGATCGSNNGSATATPVGGTAPYTYAWTGGQTTQTATALALGGYTVNVTDNRGCTANANTTIGATVNPVQICLVTVDSASTHNILVWDKTGLTSIDSFRIYREDVTNVYTHIGTVAYDSLSEYHDMSPVANPNATTKRYKISAVDACGLESVKSNYHNTIYIIYAGSGQFTWNPLYTIENTSNPVNNYVLMRDDLGTGVWNQIQSTAGTQNSITDPAFASFPNARYRVETVWGISCTSTRGAINTSRSNIKSPSSVIGINELANNFDFSFNPNPATEQIIIKLNRNTQRAQIEVYNTLGQKVIEKSTNTQNVALDITLLQTGTYFIRVSDQNGSSIKKLIKN